MNSITSGCQTLIDCILAARRVLPPDLHHRGHLVVDAHEGERAAGLAAAGELFAVGAERREVGAGAGAELEEHGLAAGELHDVFHVVFDALDEAGRALRELVRVFGLHDVSRLRVPAPVALRARDAVLVVEADVEPDGRVERPVLMQAEPGQLAVEAFAVVRRRRSSRLRGPNRRSCGRRGGPVAGRCIRARVCRLRRRNTCCR